MRLWHYKLIPVLPNAMLVSQWRECIAIKRQWEKGTLKHRLVSYVKDHNKEYFMQYLAHLDTVLTMRKIKHQNKYYDEILEFCEEDINEESPYQELPYPEHNNRYLKQCYFNLQEKYDRGIITFDEWKKIKQEMIGELYE
jgi:uncharacterized protein (TIGR02328 family)